MISIIIMFIVYYMTDLRTKAKEWSDLTLELATLQNELDCKVCEMSEQEYIVFQAKIDKFNEKLDNFKNKYKDIIYY